MKTMTTFLTTLVSLIVVGGAAADTQQRFQSPDAAVRALESAVRATNPAERMLAVLCPDGEGIASSGDPVDDAAARKRFVTALAAKKRIELSDDGALAILHVGRDDWPFPIPLKRDADGWRFDTAAGKDELLNRRIGRNELIAIEACRAYVDAQVEYAKRFQMFARSLRSTPGQRDGLYWEAKDGDASPLGPLIASATAEGYQAPEGEGPPRAYHGYFYRVLTSQGANAPGGARDYVKDGRMTGGFALVAWPAEHGVSGVMTFLVGQQGVVFQKNLGQGTSEAVNAMTTFDPDGSWDPTR